MAAPGGQIPAGGAGAAAPAADPFPIPENLTYGEYFYGLVQWLWDLGAGEKTPIVREFYAVFHQGQVGLFTATLNIHRKYLKHFFENDPAGAQRALQQFIEWLADPEVNVPSHIAMNAPGNDFPGLGVPEADTVANTIMLFINEYLKYGARLSPLRDLIASIPNDTDYNGGYDEEHLKIYDPKYDYAKALRNRLQRSEQLAREFMGEFKKYGVALPLPEDVRHAIPNALAKDAWRRRRHAMKAWGMQQRNEEDGNNGGGGGGSGNLNGGSRTRRRNRRSRNRRTRHRK